MAPQRGNDAAWGVVVPVKHLDVAKSRLSGYGEPARREVGRLPDQGSASGSGLGVELEPSQAGHLHLGAQP